MVGDFTQVHLVKEAIGLTSRIESNEGHTNAEYKSFRPEERISTRTEPRQSLVSNAPDDLAQEYEGVILKYVFMCIELIQPPSSKSRYCLDISR